MSRAREAATPQPLTVEQLNKINLYHTRLNTLVKDMTLFATIVAMYPVANFTFAVALEQPGATRRNREWYNYAFTQAVSEQHQCAGYGDYTEEQIARRVERRINSATEHMRVLSRICSTAIAASVSTNIYPEHLCPISTQEHEFEKLTQEQANAVIEKLKQSISKLKPYYHKYFYSLLLGLVFSIINIVFIQAENLLASIEQAVHLIVLIYLISKHMESPFDYERIDQSLAALNEDLNILVKKYQHNTWQLTKKHNLETSYYTLDLENYDKISFSIVANLIKDSLANNGIKSTIDDDQLRISANIVLGKNTSLRISENILNALTSMKNIRFLRKEMAKLGERLGVYFHATTTISKEGMPGCEFTVFDKSSISDVIIEKLRAFFSVNFTEKNQLLMITYKDVINPVTLKELHAFLDNYTKQKNARRNISVSSEMFLFQNNNNPKKERDKSSKLRDDVEREDVLPRDNVVLYNTNKQTSLPENPIIPNKKVYPFSAPNLPRNTFFATSALDKSEFPTKECYKVFKSQIQYPKIVARHAEQGFKLGFGYAHDKHKSQFPYQAIVKVKGRWGDCRVYCEMQKLADEKVLYVAKGISTHSHRR